MKSLPRPLRGDAPVRHAVPWPVPTGWRWGTIAEVASVSSNLVDPATVPHLPHIAPNHIVSGRPRLLPYATVEADGVKSPKHKFRPGQILYSKIRPYLRKAVLVDFAGVCSADMYPMDVRCDPYFLLWWLLSPAFNEMALRHQGRTVLPKINQEALSRVPVPIPPARVQHDLGRRLHSLARRSNDAQKELERVAGLAKRTREGVLRQAFDGRLTAADTSAWPVVPMRQLLAGIDAGKNVRCEERPPGPQECGIVKVSSVSWGAFDPKAAKTPNAHVPLDERARIRNGDFLMSRANTLELVGACVVVGSLERDNLFLSDKVLRMRLIDASLKLWIMHYLRSPEGREQIEASATGNQLSMRNISQDAIGALRVPLPAADARSSILLAVNRSLAAIGGALEAAERSAALLVRLDRVVLDRAFRGELLDRDIAAG